MGRVDGAAPLLGVSAVCGARVAAGGGVARAVVGAGGVAVRGVQVRGTGSVVGVAPVGAVSAVAPDREQHAVFDIAGGRGDSELGVSGAGAEPAASEWGLGGGARAWVGVGGDVCGPGAISRRGVRRHELGAGGADEGICAAQRGVYGRARGAEGDVRSGTEAWGAGAVGGPGGPPGVELSGDEGVLHEGGVAVVAGVVRADAGLPPWSGAQAPAGDGAGDLRLGAVVGVERAGGDGTVCETPGWGRGGTPRRAGGWRRRTRLCAGWWRTPTRTPCRTC